MGRTTQWLLVALLLVGLFAAQHYYRFRSFFGPKLEYVAGASEPPKSPGAELPRPPEWREHPDIILISVDTLRADHLGVYAYPRETSPAIDHFARDGVIFERAFVTAPKTTPSLASLLSGLAVKTHKIYDLRMPVGDSIPLVPEMLKEVGYATAGFCGQFNCDERFKLNRGFDHYDGDFSTIEENDAHSRAGGGFHPNSERRAEYLVDAATAWISDRDPAEAPIFVWLHLMDPHAGYAAPSPYPDMFSGPSIFSDQSLSGPKIPMRLIQDQALDGEIDDYDYYLNRYDAEIRYLDDRLGRFFATLRERGHYDDALILFTSDHGEYMGESTRSDRYFHHGEHTVFIQRPHARGTFAVQTRGHKLVVKTWVKTDRLIARLRDGDRINARFLLYDLEQDPLQRNDIAKANPERVTELSARLAQWLVAEPSIDSVGPSEPLPDAETLEHLRALGYVE
jgi:hypothetical protein